MSSIRKAAPRRTHRERAQPSARARLGLLEKHKDYVKRAQDFHKKEKAIKSLKEKASFKNPDEFYFGMVNAETKKGVHILKRTETFDHEFQTLLKTQDQNYINYQRSINLKKIDRLKDDIHFIEEPLASSKTHPASGEDDESSMSGMDDVDMDKAPKSRKKSKKANMGKSNHTIFVDDATQLSAFDPVVHFETVPELMDKPANRLRKSTLEEVEIPSLSPADARHVAKRKKATAEELKSRMVREDQLRKVQLELQLQKNLMGKGARRKVGQDGLGLPVYKWKSRRQK
ncbi:hypothetical protein BASA50_002833 [Batrachochytrium salamandrivorans]|uniref:U3 small nucleolar RNA-associated protein 11 n=1 Tax=Batrachochytrium salamandrivorans TaxID=1357716 RepID=A0ABQ8FK96_9FUNG|nr:hypothetical protein BASA61_007829 [Batrachochytrium salamandrivorans]KAH6599697.1 hypothetical protein BASA50_002833 [Batrachochytrium salamandrivorans]KAH9245581.1 hypothetical protein BASA81_016917 [Batrachochytrium salamandrivorans]